MKPVRKFAFALMAIVALASFSGGASHAAAAGLRNCTTMAGEIGVAGCWEDVWAGGAEYRLTFATGCCGSFKGKMPADLDAFYVIAPQAEPAQSLKAAFRHDHVVRDIPVGNHGSYSVRLHGYFVICSPAGIASGACVYELNSPAPGFTLPFAKTVNGQALTSVEPIEAAADAGLITLVDLGVAILGTINPNR